MFTSLHLTNHPVAAIEHQTCEQQPRPFLDRALDEFRDTAKFRFNHDELDGRDESADSESHEFAG